MKIPFSEYADVLRDITVSMKFHGEFTVESITNNSKNVRNSSVFTAIAGSGRDGHEFIDDAVKAGAEAVIHQKTLPFYHPKTNYIQVSNSYSAYARLAEKFYDFPARKMKLIGVTGTNGKTSSVYLLNSIFSRNGLRCGIITTVSCAWPGYLVEASRTTPEACEMQQLLSEMLENGCSHVVMEVSSHALCQNRIGTAKFAGVIFTNLTGDHLDYHGNMESYFSAKKILFENHLAPNGTAVINTDDSYGKRLAGQLPPNVRRLTFGRNEKCGCKIKIFSVSAKGTELELALEGKKIRIKSPLIGGHNAYNIAGVAVLSREFGISPEVIRSALERPINIPGRLEAFHTPGGTNVFVDYAHTDDALENVLRALRGLTDKKLFVVFGCGGDRDKTKRPRMGRVSANFADRIIVTSDNPRTEDPVKITDEIIRGIPPDANFTAIPDRREAIKKAIKEAGKGDIVLIAGKGHENYQEINGRKIHFDDREEIVSTCKMPDPGTAL